MQYLKALLSGTLNNHTIKTCLLGENAALNSGQVKSGEKTKQLQSTTLQLATVSAQAAQHPLS